MEKRKCKKYKLKIEFSMNEFDFNWGSTDISDDTCFDLPDLLSSLRAMVSNAIPNEAIVHDRIYAKTGYEAVFLSRLTFSELYFILSNSVPMGFKLLEDDHWSMRFA